ncbi:MAG: hypothetical protein HY821_17000 [Acidobacteria bacterium]|nr:hypothetical protein [Acidobacteriota bacterium]
MRMITALWLGMAAALAADFKLAVGGLGGEPDYEQRFAMLAAEHQKLAGGEALSGPLAVKANVKAALDRIAAQAKADDTFALVLIGHGTFDGMVYKFNLPGADVTAEELRVWLDRIPARQLVVVASSCSGAAAAVLKSPQRTVVSATRSGTEKTAVVFSRYWVEALRDAGADTDKNESISAQEAFQYAKAKTAAFYDTQKRLATEHPLMDESAGARFALVRFGAAQKALNDPEKRLALARREELEIAIEKLKLEKAAMPMAEYKQKLNALLLDLARTQEVIDR